MITEYAVKVFLLGLLAGVVITLMILGFLAVKPRAKALQKAWAYYQVIEDLNIQEQTSIAKK